MQTYKILNALWVGVSLLIPLPAQAQPPRFDVQGHRGCRGLVAENTLPAFRRALELGVTTLELDVVISADQQVVVSHEPWLNPEICRTHDELLPPRPGKRNNLFRMHYAQVIRECDCGQPHAQYPDQVTQLKKVYKPLLGEVIDSVVVWAKALGFPVPYFNIEIKSKPQWDGKFTPWVKDFAFEVYAVLERYPDSLRQRFMIQSFDPRALDAFAELDSSYTRVLLVENKLGLQANLARLRYPVQVYSPNYLLVDQALVNACRVAGLHLVPWTVNNPVDIDRLHKMGVDGLISDYPDRVLTIVRETVRPKQE